jgi:CHASE3 domain sensor protein
MTKTKEDKANDEVIICTDDAGMQLYLSEKAANRLSWILTGICIVLSLPVIILAFMMI